MAPRECRVCRGLHGIGVHGELMLITHSPGGPLFARANCGRCRSAQCARAGVIHGIGTQGTLELVVQRLVTHCFRAWRGRAHTVVFVKM
jgi:hypothetical protein